jgi:hypothetical protein
MLPPVLEIYLISHPNDEPESVDFAKQIMEHFHGRLFTGLIGGAIEVFQRSAPWDDPAGAPRQVSAASFAQHGLQSADVTVFVPLLGLGLAAAVHDDGDWADYVEMLRREHDDDRDHVLLIPTVLHRAALDEPVLSRLFGRVQGILEPDSVRPDRACRDLAQAIAQTLAGDGRPLTVFISHTKFDTDDEHDVGDLVAQVKAHIDSSRLGVFFDTTDLQLGTDWDETLQERAMESALLAIRTDLYASRTWCQREMWIAKSHGMPIVVLDALTSGEERGSFLMDHVPRVSLHREGKDGVSSAIDRALTLLVDESLKRVLWQRQERLATAVNEVHVDWWAPHAPEPVTLAHWLLQSLRQGVLEDSRSLRVIHPDPPLGTDERTVLDELVALGGFGQGVEVMTPAALAARTGNADGDLLPDDSLSGLRLGCSVSTSDDLDRLGLREEHVRLALGEIARAVLVSGGSLAYGGHLDPTGYTQFLVHEVQRYGRKDWPLMITLPASVHEPLDAAALRLFEREIGLLGKVVYVGPKGEELSASWKSDDAVSVAQSLTAMRRYQSARVDGRVLLGGARAKWSGAMPGLVEEALLCIEHGGALFLAGGFGGVTLDLARALGLADADFVPPSFRFPVADTVGAAAVRTMEAAMRERGLTNGLSEEENRRLAMSHRPTEVAALVALGLARLGQRHGRSDAQGGS